MKGYIFIFLTILSTVYAADRCKNVKNGEFLPHPKDCAKFFVCNFGKSIGKSCANDLHFNKEKKYCQSKSAAGCESPPIPTKPPTITTESPPIPTKPPPIRTTIRPLPPHPNVCRYQKLGAQIPFEGDCTKYITCAGGPIVNSCGPKTHFNKDLQVCDWIERAKCPWQ